MKEMINCICFKTENVRHYNSFFMYRLICLFFFVVALKTFIFIYKKQIKKGYIIPIRCFSFLFSQLKLLLYLEKIVEKYFLLLHLDLD